MEKEDSDEVSDTLEENPTREPRMPEPMVEPRRKRGVTETPDMNVVIGYNLYPEGVKGGVPRILINAEPLPDPETIRRNGLPGFETVVDCKRVIFRRVPGNNFFYELIKTNAKHERIFLICEPTEGCKILNLSGRNFKILFVGREGTELLAIRPCPNTKETVSVIYKQQEVGRILRHSTGGDGSVTHTILDRDLKKVFILRKKVHHVNTTQCCFQMTSKKLDTNTYQVFGVKNGGVNKETMDESPCVASICMVDTEIKFSSNESPTEELGLIDKTLLLATLVSIKTKAMESAGIGFRISLTF